MATNKKPTHTLRCGNIKATIWQNESEKGPFFATTFSRPFKDQSGAWRNGTSFGLNDLEALMSVGLEAEQSRSAADPGMVLQRPALRAPLHREDLKLHGQPSPVRP